jgi:dTDP-4-amino-4,6-dideoxygalactose transaminase
MQSLGGNYRMTDIQAALGRSQLSKLAFFKQRRREIVDRYNTVFADIPYITTPYEEKNADSCFHLYVLQIDFDRLGKHRRQVMEELRGKGIGTQVHYIPVNSQPYYTSLIEAYDQNDFPVAESYYDKCLTIPLYPMMKDIDVEYVTHIVSCLIG